MGWPPRSLLLACGTQNFSSATYWGIRFALRLGGTLHSIHLDPGLPLEIRLQRLEEAQKSLNAELILIPAERPFAFEEVFKLLETFDAPILMLPRDLRALGSIQVFRVMLDPEGTQDRGLEAGIRLGRKLGIPVELLHITEGLSGQKPSVFSVCDEFHHEYPESVRRMLRQAAPMLRASELQSVERLEHREGRVGQEILKRLETGTCGVLQWKGSFAPGRAQVLRGILEQQRESPPSSTLPSTAFREKCVFSLLIIREHRG